MNPYSHVLNGSGEDCEDGTSCAGAVPCPACEWAMDRALIRMAAGVKADAAITELERMFALEALK